VNTLHDLIVALAAADQTYVPPIGFSDPHSYRGYYEDLAFSECRGVSVAEMLATASACVGRTFTGYKGGEYMMYGDTRVWIAPYGESGGDCIGPVLHAYLTGAAK
jgi:hypothetical protein